MRNKIKPIFSVLKHLYKTIFFNFYYLPFNQAIKLPIVFMSNVKFISMKGTVKIVAPIQPGMIRIGVDGNVLYKQFKTSVIWANYGGTVEFGNMVIYNKGASFEIGSKATLHLGNNLHFGPLHRIACYDNIYIDDNTRCAWETIIMDTDFHSTINVETGEQSPLTKPIHIGKNNWIGTKCMVMKGAVTPDFCIASACSLLNKKYDIPNYSLIGGIPAKFIKQGLFRDLNSHVNEDEQAA